MILNNIITDNALNLKPSKVGDVIWLGDFISIEVIDILDNINTITNDISNLINDVQKD